MMKLALIPACCVALALASVTSALIAQSASPVDKTFVGKVSQGGAFEVQASQLAEKKAAAQDVKDIASMEVHDHQLVNDKLKSLASEAKIDIASQLNPELQGKLDALAKLNVAAFDASYMSQMKQIHDKDQKLFAQEAADGGTPDFRKFAAETDRIVKRHIGALHGTDGK
jgi:putative membrane protein